MLEIDENLRETEPDCISGSKQHDLMLRTPAQRDLGVIVSLATNAALIKNLCHSPLPASIGEAKTWLADLKVRNKATTHYFMLTSMIGEIYGVAWLDPADATDTELELGVILHQTHWGQNIATHAVQAMADFAFSNPTTTDKTVRHVTAHCRVSCARSRRVMEKCGFQYSGTGMARSSHYRGMIPVDRFKLDHGIWTALRHWNPNRTSIVPPESDLPEQLEGDKLRGAA